MSLPTLYSGNMLNCLIQRLKHSIRTVTNHLKVSTNQGILYLINQIDRFS